jgi:hypothetical protein
MHRDRIHAIAARTEEIQTNSAEYLWICRGIKPPLLADRPVATRNSRSPASTEADTTVSPSIDLEQLELQRRLLSGSAHLKRKGR